MSTVPINKKRLARYSDEIQAKARAAGKWERGLLIIELATWNEIINGAKPKPPEPRDQKPRHIEPCPRCGTPIVGRCGRRCNGCGYAPGCAD